MKRGFVFIACDGNNRDFWEERMCVCFKWWFVIKGDRSNNAILKVALLSWPLKWKGVRYSYRMVFVMIWKYASSVFIFARTNSDQIYLASSRSALGNADSEQQKVCKSCACRMLF